MSPRKPENRGTGSLPKADSAGADRNPAKGQWQGTPSGPPATARDTAETSAPPPDAARQQRLQKIRAQLQTDTYHIPAEQIVAAFLKAADSVAPSSHQTPQPSPRKKRSSVKATDLQEPARPGPHDGEPVQ